MTIKFVTAAALAATMSTAAFASGASVGADANVGGAGADAAVSAEANTGMGASSSENASGLSQGNLMAELKNGQANSASWSSQIAALGDDATVNIVSLSELKGESAENSAARAVRCRDGADRHRGERACGPGAGGRELLGG